MPITYLMKIAINYFGLPRQPQYARYIFDNFIYNSAHEFHLMYTTWNVENTAAVERQFPDIFIRKEAVPSPQVLGKLLTDYALDETNIVLRKSLRHFLLGIYIKDKSRLTVEEYETAKDIKFDLIITLRLDTDIQNAHLGQFFKSLNINTPTMYVAKDSTQDTYGEGAVPDSLLIGGRDFHLKSLQLLDALPHCTLRDKRTFHPETTAYKAIIYHGGRVEYLPFYAYIYPKK